MFPVYSYSSESLIKSWYQEDIRLDLDSYLRGYGFKTKSDLANDLYGPHHTLVTLQDKSAFYKQQRRVYLKVSVSTRNLDQLYKTISIIERYLLNRTEEETLRR
jgi:hypothetical protein